MPGATTKKFYLHAIQLPSGAWITELDDTTPSMNSELITSYASGASVPSWRGGHGIKPELRFTTPQIKEVIDLCYSSMTHHFFGADLSAGNVDLYYRGAENLGTQFDITESEHLRLRFLQSYLYWERIQAKQGDLATIACRLIPLYDGTNVPIVPLGSTTIPANVLADEFFGLGKLILNSAQIDALSEWNIELNPTVLTESSSGEDYQSFACMARQDPVLTFRSGELEMWDPNNTPGLAIGTAGLEITTMVAYLRKRKQNSTIGEPDASAVHIKISNETGAKGHLTLDETTGGLDNAAEMPARVGWAIDDATLKHPLTADTAIAIT